MSALYPHFPFAVKISLQILSQPAVSLRALVSFVRVSVMLQSFSTTKHWGTMFRWSSQLLPCRVPRHGVDRALFQPENEPSAI
jgi:hypothetical protein